MASYENFADKYDSLCKEYEHYNPEILFGLVFEYVREDDRLLDRGIGTGLSSSLFKMKGLHIFGVDNSEEMLNICRQKGISEDFKVFDLRDEVLPYDNEEFDHVISCGLFNFFKELTHFFKQSYRVLKKGGIFSFSVEDLRNRCEKILERTDEEWGIKMYAHSQDYIGELIQQHGFTLLKRLGYLMLNEQKEELRAEAYVLRK